ncbi:hypothetical protein PHMEG_00013665 [Phytophthora megakarya]|uniref:CCHC-type domain-containing protein n=1 Tax=Phytophthora megakarya TaxID=4795 RepID=A0A225W5T1_9STRA|nr:hypothetical protein PHMEG_00013665 [Phytophthora megakarya]
MNTDVRDPIFINILIRSLPENHPFDHLRGMVETGSVDVDTPDKLRNQILRMDRYNKSDRELSALRDSAQNQHQGYCFNCHKPGHIGKDCLKKATEPSSAPAKKQVSYTKRVQNSNAAKPKPTCTTEDESSGVESKCVKTGNPACNETKTASKSKGLSEPTNCVQGFKKKFAATSVGHGTVKIVEKRGELEVILTLQDVFHVPDSKNFMSNSQAEDQGYAVEYHGRSGDKNTSLTGNDDGDKTNEIVQPPISIPWANISSVHGCATLQRWHQRLGHLCQQFLKIMVDRDLMDEMMLRQ